MCRYLFPTVLATRENKLWAGRKSMSLFTLETDFSYDFCYCFGGERNSHQRQKLLILQMLSVMGQNFQAFSFDGEKATPRTKTALYCKWV